MPNAKSELRVQVVDDEIIVTRPGSYYSVIYYKPDDFNSPLFVAIWYVLAIGLMSMFGLVIGRHALRW